jgi:DNA-binding transcriptional MerR regulator
MKESTPYELPNACEKLSYKFILDELKDRQFEKALDPVEVIETKALAEAPAESPIQLQVTLESYPTEENLSLPIRELALPPGKKYFRIGEVSELIGVESYVLRYWENEFKAIRPIKSKSGHRVYGASDVVTLHQIRHLLHVEKFSVKGAKKRLQELKRKPPQVTNEFANRHKETLKQLLVELKQLVHIAKANPGSLN